MQSTPTRGRHPTAGDPVSAAPNDGASASDPQGDMDETDVANGQWRRLAGQRHRSPIRQGRVSRIGALTTPARPRGSASAGRAAPRRRRVRQPTSADVTPRRGLDTIKSTLLRRASRLRGLRPADVTQSHRRMTEELDREIAPLLSSSNAGCPHQTSIRVHRSLKEMRSQKAVPSTTLAPASRMIQA